MTTFCESCGKEEVITEIPGYNHLTGRRNTKRQCPKTGNHRIEKIFKVVILIIMTMLLFGMAMV